jgi:adenosylcobinamide-GDP ribazoletransferase
MAYERISECLTDLKIGAMFLTRLPLSHQRPVEKGELSRALWTAPLIGAGVGAIGAAVYVVAHALHVPPIPAAGLAIAATAGVTGCLHEDGLADVADGFGGGSTRESKLEIMRDSRIGTYGVCALLLSFLLRVGILASLDELSLVAAALICAGAAARAGLPAFMALVPAARDDGMSAHAGIPPPASAIAAALVGAAVLIGVLGSSTAIVAILCLAASFGFMAVLCTRQINGQTGDVLGALEQVGEIVVLLVAASSL